MKGGMKGRSPAFSRPRLARSAATRLDNTPQRLPPRSLGACPLCHAPIHTTALRCTQCGAEKHYGPLRRESLLHALAGLLLLLGLTWLIFPRLLWPPSFWLALLLSGGLAVGFIFAQFRFAGDRWIKLRR